METIEVTAQLTTGDLFRLQIATLRRRGTLYAYGAVMFLGLCFLVRSLSADDDEFSLFCAIFLLFLPGIMTLFLYSVARRQLKENVAMQHPFLYRLSDEGLYVEWHRGNALIPWGEVFDKMESGSAFYVYLSSMQSYILPKRCFDPRQIERVKELFAVVPRNKYVIRQVINIVFAAFAAFISVLMLFETLLSA